MPDRDDTELGPLAPGGQDSGASGPPPLSPSPMSREGRRLPIVTIGAVMAAGLIGVAIGQILPDKPPAQAPAAAPATASPVGAGAQDKGVQVQVETRERDATPPAPPTPMPTVPPQPNTARSAVTPPAPAPTAQADPAEPAPQPATRRTSSSPPADPACAYAAGDPASGCSDPEFIEADRALYAAYQAARRAGVPARDLRADQADWRDASEEAAARSKAALLAAYRERTELVWGMVQAWQDGAEADDDFAPPRFGRR